MVCTDTRDIKKGAVFFALKGPSFNGNTFAEKALELGCTYAVVDDDQCVKDRRYLLVPDVLESLQALANYHRRMLKTRVIAITGSNGKTTSKELLSAVLSKKYSVLATKGNLNNHIGVPLTLLSVIHSHELAIVEMGANHIGEIAVLCEIAEPDFGLITNIGLAHLEGFGSEEGVVKGKTELYQYLKNKNGLLFVNADNELLCKRASGIRMETYGTTNQATVQGILVKTDPFVQLRWKRTQANKPLIAQPLTDTHLAGNYNFENVLAAACIGSHFGVEDVKINEALHEYVPSNSRSQLIEKGSCKILMDAYNANPSSMAAAIDNFSALPWLNKVLVLGDMYELGSRSEEEHRTLLNLIGKSTYAEIFLVGKHFKAVAAAEPAAGSSSGAGSVRCFETAGELCEYLNKHPLKNSSVLIKGSRAVGLEKVLAVFKEL